MWPRIVKGLGDEVGLSVSCTVRGGFGQADRAGIIIPGLGNHGLK